MKTYLFDNVNSKMLNYIYIFKRQCSVIQKEYSEMKCIITCKYYCNNY